MMTPKTFSHLRSQLQGARDGIAQLNTREAEIREAYARTCQRRDRLSGLPPPVDEVVANMRALVDAKAASWAQDHRHRIVSECGGLLELRMDGTYDARPPSLPSLSFSFEVRDTDLIGLFPDLVKTRVEAVIRSEPFEHAGPMSARRQDLAAAEAEIRAIEDEHAELVDLAASFEPPIVLELLPAVRERRQAAAAKAQREATAREARRAAEDVVNQRRLAQPGTVRSAYLAGDKTAPPADWQ